MKYGTVYKLSKEGISYMSEMMTNVIAVAFGLIALGAAVFGIWYERSGTDNSDDKKKGSK